MKKAFFMLICFVLVVASTIWALDYPSDWKSWTKVETPLTQIGVIPGCDADISKLPEIYQETVFTYCDVKEGGPGKVEVLVKPSMTKIFKSRSGKYSDGENLILHLMDMKILFVTGYEKGKPTYGVFTESGKNIMAPTGPLSEISCVACHTGYSGFCINGQCATQK